MVYQTSKSDLQTVSYESLIRHRLFFSAPEYLFNNLGWFLFNVLTKGNLMLNPTIFFVLRISIALVTILVTASVQMHMFHFLPGCLDFTPTFSSRRAFHLTNKTWTWNMPPTNATGQEIPLTPSQSVKHTKLTCW